MASRWIGELLDLILGKPADTAAASGASGSLHAHIRSVQDTVATIAGDTTTDIPALIGAGTDAVVNPGTAGSLHGHIRDAQTELDALIVTVGDSTAAAADLDGTGAVKVFAGLRKIRDLITTVDTVVDTIAADVVETAIGRYQTPTWEDDDIATDAAALAVMTCKVGELDVSHVSLELVDAAAAQTTSFRVEHRRGAVVLMTFIPDADAPKAVWATNGGYQVPWEDAAEAFAIDDTLHLVPTGAAGGTNHVKVRVTCRARANGAYMLVTA